jgi:hypothetical protein
LFSFKGHCHATEKSGAHAIPVNRVVDPKRIIRKNGGPRRRRRSTRARWPPKKKKKKKKNRCVTLYFGLVI